MNAFRLGVGWGRCSVLLALLASSSCGPGGGLGGGGLTAFDADGAPLGTVVGLDTHWVDVFHAPTNAVMRINMTTGNVTGPGRAFIELSVPIVYDDYFFTEGDCGEGLWRAAPNDEDCDPPAVGEIVALGADALGWEEGESVWVSGGDADNNVVPGEPVINDERGNLVCDGSASSGEAALCRQVQDAFNDAVQMCDAQGQTYDVWFGDSACEGANDDGYDNTDFYNCLVVNFSNPDVDHTCETDGSGNPEAVRQFEDTSEVADPPGCRELYQATPDASGGGPGANRFPTYQIGVETCAYEATETEDVPTSFPAPLTVQ
jgi:hypothetical protein